MAEFPAMPFWTDAYLADAGHLSTIEHGAYILLLLTMWRNGGFLPNDDAQLAKFARLSMPKWLKIKPSIIGFFISYHDTISQKRLQKEFEYVKRIQKKNSDNAKAKWLKTKNTGDAVADFGMPVAYAPTPIPTPISKSSLRSDLEASSLCSDATRAKKPKNGFDDFWKKYPSKVGKGAARSAFEKALKRTSLDELMTGLDRYVHKQDDRQWCNPATWLNQERWSDVPAQVQPMMRRPESEFARNNREFKEALEARIFGEKKNDDTFGSDGPSFDIGPDDFRIVR